MRRTESVRDVFRRTAWWLSTPTGLAVLFVAGLLLRLVLATGGEFPSDVGSFQAWATRMAERGPGRFYPAPGEDFFVDYPPGLLYVLWGLGKLAGVAGYASPPIAWIKIPWILADIGVAWLAVVLAGRLAPESVQRRFPYRAIVASAVLLNPAFFFISARWGQADSVAAFLVLACLVLIGTGRPSFLREGGGMVVLAVAVASKPQAVFVVPFVIGLLVWRHVVRPAASRDGDESVGRIVGAGLARLAGLGLVAAGTGLLLFAPFGLDVSEVVAFYRKAGSTYPYTSVFAHNLWGIVGFWKPDSGPEAWRLLGLEAWALGLVLFTVGSVALVLRGWRSLTSGEGEARILVLGAAAMNLLGFVVLTRIHERYLLLALAVLAPLVVYRTFRLPFIALSVAYLVNVYYPYVYYLEQNGRHPPKIPALFNALYGSDYRSLQMKAISAATAGVALWVAWRGWTWLERSSKAASAGLVDEGRLFGRPTDATETDVDARPVRWTLALHPVGRRGAAWALLAFVLVLATRLPGLSHPPGMYFDEVYHARTAGEYLQHKDVYEFTHPPLGKELIALSIKHLADFGVRARGRLPSGMGAVAASDGASVAWASRTGTVHLGRFTSECGIRPTSESRLTMRPTAIDVRGSLVFVGGTTDAGATLMKLDAGRERWSAKLPAAPVSIAVVADTVFAVTSDGGLHAVTSDGKPQSLASGAAAVTALPRSDAAWASFPDERRAASWGADTTSKSSVEVQGRPRSIVFPNGDRVVVSDIARSRIETIDAKAGKREAEVPRVAGHMLTSIPDTGLVWAVDGRNVRVVEPQGGSVIGRTTVPETPRALLTDTGAQQVVAVGRDGLACVGGRPFFAWRFGSAIFGSLVAVLAMLIALRLFGSLVAAGLAALFVAVDGLAFTLSRIAMIDSYAAAFILGAWFCVLSALWWWGARAGPEPHERSRSMTLLYLAAGGVLFGCAMATKWVGVYAALGLAVIFAVDVRREREGIWWLTGGPIGSIAVLAVLFGLLPAGVYVASYLPYFGLGHDFGELVALQKSMYYYHANLTATHPYGSSWFGWPFGRRAVYLYVRDFATERQEMWTAPNLVVFWGGLVGMVAAAVQTVRRRSLELGIVVLAALVQYLPWTIVHRVTFIYHYLPIVPFLAIALAWACTIAIRELPSRKAIAAGVAVAAVAMWVVLLPVLTGISVSFGYLDALKRTMRWVF